MKIIGLGIDLVSLERMKGLLDHHGDRFRARCFRAGELPDGRAGDPGTVGGRWAAKEAVLKALGADVSGVPYRDIEVVPADAGPPTVALHGAAHRLFEAAGGRTIHLTSSHERDHALAFAIVCG